MFPPLRTTAGVLLSLAMLAGAYWGGERIVARHGGMVAAADIPGLLWPIQPVLQPFALEDMRGGRLNEESLRGHWTLLFLGYTHCPDICPTTLHTLAQASARLRDFAPFAQDGQVLFVSVDYARDTPAVLRPYVEYFNPAFRAASAPPAQLHVLIRQLDMTVVKTSGDDSEEYWFDHSSEIVMVGPDLKVLALFDFPHEPADIAQRVQAVINFTRRPR